MKAGGAYMALGELTRPQTCAGGPPSSCDWRRSHAGLRERAGRMDVLLGCVREPLLILAVLGERRERLPRRQEHRRASTAAGHCRECAGCEGGGEEEIDRELGESKRQPHQAPVLAPSTQPRPAISAFGLIAPDPGAPCRPTRGRSYRSRPTLIPLASAHLIHPFRSRFLCVSLFLLKPTPV